VGYRAHGGICTNVGIRALFLLLDALINEVEKRRRNFEARNASATEIADEVRIIAEPLLKYLSTISDVDFGDRFSRKYGSGGPPEYYYELCQVLWEQDPAFSPAGLPEYIASKDEVRVKDAEATIKFIENRVSEIVIGYFKRKYGDRFWNYVGTKEMRVKAYERQQEEDPEKQLELDAYLDFIDKKRIIERSDNWNAFKEYFDIPLPGEKGFAKNLRWMDRLNELRRVVAHPHKRSFKPEDLSFLEWIRKTFEERLLAQSSPDA
jgi:DNA sulfur modification protein DndB